MVYSSLLWKYLLNNPTKLFSISELKDCSSFVKDSSTSDAKGYEHDSKSCLNWVTEGQTNILTSQSMYLWKI